MAVSTDRVAIDTEGTGLNVYDGRDYGHGVSVAFEYKGRLVAHYMPFLHHYGPNLDRRYRDMLKEVIEFRVAQQLPFTFHNAKYDLTVLEKMFNIDLSGMRFYDTLLMAHFTREEQPFNKGLDSLGKFYIGDPGKKVSPEFKKFTEKIGWKYVPSEGMYEYAAWDSHLTYRVEKHLRTAWDTEGLDTYWFDRKVKTIHVLRKMESRGVLVDQDLCNQQIKIANSEMEDAVELLGLNPGSPKQLKELLLDKMGLPIVKTTPKGGPSFDREAMELYDQILELRSDTTAELVKMYRGWQKSKSASFESYLKLLSPDGRVRPHYKLHGTKTGRLSCEKPNLQQIPKISSQPWNAKTKRSFIEVPGWTLYEADYSQLELRLATAYAQEPSLMEIFNEGRDIFTEMALLLGMERQAVKTMVYSIQYGAGLKRLMHVFGWTEGKASDQRENYRQTFPKIHGASAMAQQQARTKGYVRMWTGRCRHFEDRRTQSHKGFNAAIQGGAADIVEGTMHRLFDELDNDESARMLLQVHDSVVFAIRDDLVDVTIPRIQSIMEDVEHGKFGVKFAVDVHKWGE
jgi:DNA polymerase I